MLINILLIIYTFCVRVYVYVGVHLYDKWFDLRKISKPNYAFNGTIFRILPNITKNFEKPEVCSSQKRCTSKKNQR